MQGITVERKAICKRTYMIYILFVFIINYIYIIITYFKQYIYQKILN